ncbi:hypothetical protein SFUMM280S_07836 [Streptomyces fumanus]
MDPRDRERVRQALRGQVVAGQLAADGAVLAATGVQTAGALDDLYPKATGADLGPVFREGRPTLSVWAPTARSVRLELDGAPKPMRRDDTTGVWSVTGPASWKNKPYRYVVKVWSPGGGPGRHQQGHRPVRRRPHRRLRAEPRRRPRRQVPRAERLGDPEEAEGGPAALRPDPGAARPGLLRRGPHRRSTGGPTFAFTDQDSDGSRHLRKLARAGTSYVHLLPVFDIATIPEKRSDQATVDCDLAALPADPSASRSAWRRRRRRTPTTGGTTRTTTRSPRAPTPPTRTARPARSSSARWSRRSTRTACGSSWTSSTTTRRPAARREPASWTGSCPATTSGCSPTARSRTAPAAPTRPPRTP